MFFHDVVPPMVKTGLQKSILSQGGRYRVWNGGTERPRPPGGEMTLVEMLRQVMIGSLIVAAR